MFVGVVVLAGCRLHFEDRAGGAGDGDANDGALPGDDSGDGAAGPCVVDVAARTRGVCAVRSDATVWCWGFNLYGQLADGTTTDNPLPQQIPNLPPVKAIAMGVTSTYALGIDGSVWAWGDGRRYQLANNDMTEQHAPVQITGLPAQIDELTAGESHACVRSAANVYCWGWNVSGQVGNGTSGAAADQPTPALVLTNAARISAGGRNTCAILTDQSVACWGSNFQGQVGIGNFVDPQPTPQVIPSFTAEEIVVGGRVACVRRSDGSVWCWGRNWTGVLNDGTTNDRDTPVQIAGVANATAIPRVLGGRRMCARIAGGSVSCWGEPMYGDTGPPPPPLLAPEAPRTIAALDGAALVVALSGFTCGRVADGTLSCSGDNVAGQLGDGTMTARTSFAPVMLSCP